MGKTYKIERARALRKGESQNQFHGLEKPKRKHKDIKLTLKDKSGVIDRETGEHKPYFVDDGGRRWGDQRKMRARIKVKARKSERMKNKKIDLE